MTSVGLGDGSRQGTNHVFAFCWQHQVWKYEALICMNAHNSDGTKRMMLENTTFYRLSNKQQAAQFKTQTGSELSDKQYRLMGLYIGMPIQGRENLSI